jgi:hypothetical protein
LQQTFTVRVFAGAGFLIRGNFTAPTGPFLTAALRTRVEGIIASLCLNRCSKQKMKQDRQTLSGACNPNYCYSPFMDMSEKVAEFIPEILITPN